MVDLQYIFNTILINSDSFITGTSAWNYPHPRDIDICASIGMKRYVIAWAADNKLTLTDGEYHNSLLITENVEKPIQFIFLNEQEMEIWRRATEAMKHYPAIVVKEIRHAVFEQLRALEKMISSL